MALASTNKYYCILTRNYPFANIYTSERGLFQESDTTYNPRNLIFLLTPWSSHDAFKVPSNIKHHLLILWAINEKKNMKKTIKHNLSIKVSISQGKN